MFNTRFIPNVTFVVFNLFESDCQNQGKLRVTVGLGYSSKDLAMMAFLYSQTFLPMVPTLNLNTYDVIDTVGISRCTDIQDMKLTVKCR